MINLGDNWLAGTDNRARYTFGIDYHIYCKYHMTICGGTITHCPLCKRKVPKEIKKKFNFIFPESRYY